MHLERPVTLDSKECLPKWCGHITETREPVCQAPTNRLRQSGIKLLRTVVSYKPLKDRDPYVHTDKVERRERRGAEGRKGSSYSRMPNVTAPWNEQGGLQVGNHPCVNIMIKPGSGRNSQQMRSRIFPWSQASPYRWFISCKGEGHLLYNGPLFSLTMLLG